MYLHTLLRLALAENPKSNFLLEVVVGKGISSKSKGFETKGAFSSTKSESINEFIIFQKNDLELVYFIIFVKLFSKF